MCGRKVATPRAPTKLPRNTADPVVVIPGLTGLPSTPTNPMSIARLLSSASRPPTMKRFGQSS